MCILYIIILLYATMCVLLVPADSESKTKGKAAVDVIGNPLGKSGGSFLQQVDVICNSISIHVLLLLLTLLLY